MAKESGIGMTVGVDIGTADTLKQIENDVTNLDFSTPRGVQDSTGVDSVSNERILLLADFSTSLTGIFNDATDKSFDVLKRPDTSTTRTVTIVHSLQTLTNECVLHDTSWSRSATGELTWSSTLSLNSTTAPVWS
jgi:hypothetical protein